VLTLPPEAVITPALERRLTLDVHRPVTSAPLVVYTTKGRTTMESIVGGAGALGVSRIATSG
jgi:hypothetical protein